MKKAILVFVLLVGMQALAVGEAEQAAEKGNISEQVIFLYYADIEEPARFYQSILGFEPTLELDWVRILKTNQGASVGLVDESKGSLKSSGDKPVMLSWVTDDVDGWHEYLKEKGVKILSTPSNNEEAGIRAFLFQDPGGYTLEFFQWTR
jgi:predicted enzyme related to lactoylglutathione lyase